MNNTDTTKIESPKKRPPRKNSKDTPWIDNKIFTYGAKRPVENLDLFNDQLRTAHVFRNSMVELEQSRRAYREAALSKFPDYELPEIIKTVIEEKVQRREALRDEKKRIHSRSRSKKVITKQLSASIKTLTDSIKSLKERRKQLRASIYGSEEWKSGEEARNDWLNAEMRKRYEAAGMNSWGTAVRIQKETELARKHKEPPKFKRWHQPGEGKIAVQLQNGITLEEALSGQDSQLRIELVEDGIWTKGSRKKLPKKPQPNLRVDKDGYPMRYLGNAWVRLRIASRNKKGEIINGGHTPVWITFPTIIHRDLPDASLIKWAWLQKTLVGLDERWEFQMVVAQDTRVAAPDPTAATSGWVAIDVGWRCIPNPDKCGFEPNESDRSLPRECRDIKHATDCPQSDLRVAYWVGSDGQKGELCLPSRWLCAYYKVRDIDSIRQKRFNKMIEKINDWRKTRKVPDWLSKTMRHSHSWKSQAHLGKLYSTWKKDRFNGDEEMFSELKEWNSRDIHLMKYVKHLREQNKDYRKEVYRRFAYQLRRQYATVCLEDIDLRELAARKKPEESHLDNDAAKLRRNAAAISVLRDSLKNKLAEVKVPAAGTSYTCYNCGWPSFIGNADISMTCKHCGTTWDRDENAARNILERGIKQSKLASETVVASA